MIISAANVLVRIKRIDTSQPITKIREKLDAVRRFSLWVGPVIGFAWWLIWIPVVVAAGFDQVLRPNSLSPSLIVGVIGIAVSFGLYAMAMKSEHWRQKIGGRSVTNAERELTEIEQTNIR